ncbi:MAG: P27 family phage terminase small subunit [Oscillospiraceae bacterium]|nr:P27 family phage terminase small subunit [Oscillospiraceae bacterium]
MANFKRTDEYRQLKRSLNDNLAARGLTDPIYADMVRRYLSFREMEYLADQDIAKNGLNILDERRGSMMANPCVSAKLNASRQATAIYKALGFEDKAKDSRAAGDDDFDEL